MPKPDNWFLWVRPRGGVAELVLAQAASNTGIKQAFFLVYPNGWR